MVQLEPGQQAGVKPLKMRLGLEEGSELALSVCCVYLGTQAATSQPPGEPVRGVHLHPRALGLL